MLTMRASVGLRPLASFTALGQFVVRIVAGFMDHKPLASIINSSGGGGQAFWILDTPISRPCVGQRDGRARA
jgi:hypothetical protein